MLKVSYFFNVFISQILKFVHLITSCLFIFLLILEKIIDQDIDL